MLPKSKFFLDHLSGFEYQGFNERSHQLGVVGGGWGLAIDEF